MQRETLQICAVVIQGQTSESQIAPPMEQDDRKGGDDGSEGWMEGEEAQINATKAQPVWGSGG